MATWCLKRFCWTPVVLPRFAGKSALKNTGVLNSLVVSSGTGEMCWVHSSCSDAATLTEDTSLLLLIWQQQRNMLTGTPAQAPPQGNEGEEACLSLARWTTRNGGGGVWKGAREKGGGIRNSPPTTQIPRNSNLHLSRYWCLALYVKWRSAGFSLHSCIHISMQVVSLATLTSELFGRDMGYVFLPANMSARPGSEKLFSPCLKRANIGMPFNNQSEAIKLGKTSYTKHITY